MKSELNFEPKEKLSIPIIKIFKESFCHIWQNKLSWLRIAFLPIVLNIVGFLIFGILYLISKEQGLKTTSYYDGLIHDCGFINLSYAHLYIINYAF